jgi:hypothetical protein
MPHADPVNKSEASDIRRTRATRVRSERRLAWIDDGLEVDPDPYDQDNDARADR